jgi:hypothetical protein
VLKTKALENKEWLAMKKAAKWHQPHPNNSSGEEERNRSFSTKV